MKIRELFKTKEFKTNLLKTIGISFLMLILIYPDAIIRVDQFVYNQAFLSRAHGRYPFKLDANIIMLKNAIPLLIFLIVAPIAIAISVRFEKSNQKTLFLACTLGTLIFTIHVLIHNRLFISAHYFLPFIPFMIISLSASFMFLFKTKYHYFWKIFLGYFLVLNLFISGQSILSSIKDRYDYKNSITVKFRDYILNNISIESKIAYDHTIALPTTYTGCHTWGCDMKTFMPDFAFIEEGNPYAEKLEKYITDSKMKLKEKICHKTKCVLVYTKA